MTTTFQSILTSNLHKCDTQPAKRETSAFISGELSTVLDVGHAFPCYRASTECETSVFTLLFLFISVPLHDNTHPMPPGYIAVLEVPRLMLKLNR